MQGHRLEIANQVARIAAATEASRLGKQRKVAGRNGADHFLLDADEILAFQAERELVWMITAKQRLVVTQSLRTIQERLGEEQLQRIHRNAIVNVSHVRKMSALGSQRWLITLSNVCNSSSASGRRTASGKSYAGRFSVHQDI
jgi:DNA-binding LytR/AlgR family response regulator